MQKLEKSQRQEKRCKNRRVFAPICWHLCTAGLANISDSMFFLGVQEAIVNKKSFVPEMTQEFIPRADFCTGKKRTFAPKQGDFCTQKL